MSSSVSQQQKSSIESQLVEPCVLRHNLAPPILNFSQTDNNFSGHCDQKSNNNEELSDWSCIQTLTNTSHSSIEVTDYVHPIVKRSSSILSMKSLEVCTESLGSETGSDISEGSDEFSSLISENQNFHPMQQSKPREYTKKVVRRESFPPPLSSIRGSGSLRVRPHREGGRLIIKAVSVPPRNSYLQATRVNGRLRICLLKDCSPCCESMVASDDGKIEQYHDDVEEHDKKSEELYASDDDYDDDDDSGGDCWSEGNAENFGCEIGAGDPPRPSRCKEGGGGNKEMSRWGQIYVAIP